MPRIARAVLALSFALLNAGPTAGRAASLLVGPPEALDELRLEAQDAVIDVRPSGEVDVDVHLAFSDEAEEPREFYLVVLLATPAEFFEVKAASGAGFGEERVAPLSHESFKLKCDTDNAFVNAGVVGGLVGGPAAFASALVSVDHLRNTATEHARVLSPPDDSVAVACVGWQMYDSLDVGELAGAVGAAFLPEGVLTALDPYIGGPFALVRLQTRPDFSHDLRALLWRGQSPGLRLSFRQQMQDEHGALSYAYPLQIGQGQGGPVAVVSAFVTARDALVVSPQFRPPPSLLNMSSSRAWMTENHGRHRHIYHFSLLNWRPQEDLVLETAKAGTPAHQREQRRLLLAWVLFPLAGAVAWVLAFGLLVWPTPTARQMGWVRAVVKSWGGPYLLAFGPMYLVMYGWAITPNVNLVQVGWDRFLTEVWSDTASLICLLLLGFAALLTVFMAWRILVALTAGERDTNDFHARALLTSALAGLLYLAAVRMLAP